jgi:uncharacterized protein YcfL
MKAVLFIILVILLVGCSTFGEKFRQNQQLTCSPSYETLCAGWQV